MSKKAKKATKVTAAPAKKSKRAKVAAPVRVLSGRTRAVEQNGVKQPIKGVCRDVWDALSKLHQQGTEPTAQHLKALVAKRKWNPSNASIEMGRWRKFSGLSVPKALPRMSAEDVIPYTA